MSEELKISITDDGSKQPQQSQEPAQQPSESASSSVPRFTQAEWERMAKTQPGMREAMVKSGAMQSPAQAQAAQKAGAPGSVTSQSTNIQEEADRRLKKIAREKEIDEEMRAQDKEYAAQQADRDEERARRAELRLTTQQDRDETYASRQEVLDEKRASREGERQQLQQERDENAVARQESADAKLAARQLATQNRQQDRDEDYAARQELRDWKMAQREVKLVPEAVALHDEEAYAKNARAAMANRERAKRQKEVRREIDPEFAQSEDDRESKERAKLMAMGGAAIGGKAGRLMGIASQVMGNPESMRMLGGMFGPKRPETKQAQAPQPVRAEQAPTQQSPNPAQPERAQAQPPPEPPATEAQRPAPRMPADNFFGRERAKPQPEPTTPADSLLGRERPPAQQPQQPQERQEGGEWWPAANTPRKENGPPKSERVSQPMPPKAPAQASPKAAAPATGAAAAEGASAAAGGAMAGAAAALPIAGAVIAVAQMVKQVIDEVGESGRKATRVGIDASKAVVSGDVDQRMAVLVGGFDAVADGAAKLSPALGLVTPAAKEFVHGIDEMRHTVKQTAERLAQYNGQLAGQTAQHEVREMLRDINRAQRMGGQVTATNAARFNFEQKIQDIADRLMPLFLKLGEKTFALLERFFAAVDDGLQVGLRISDAILAGIQAIISILPGVAPLTVLHDIRRLLAEMLGDSTDATDDADWTRFLRGIGPAELSTVTPMAPAPGPVVGMP